MESTPLFMPSTPAISVTNLTKTFETVRAVKGISFYVPAGKVFGLLGGNGAGKTTTISMILGALLPTEGSIQVLGHDMTKDRFGALSRMNFASPYVNLPLRLTVHQNLKVYGLLYGIHHVEDRIQQLADDLDIGFLMKTPARKLSSGQKTRVTLAKALLNAPDVLLLDEPTASLDPDTGDFIRSYLEAYASRTHCAILLASHNMMEVERLCDHIMLLKSGQIRAQGTTTELCHQFHCDSLEDVFLDVARTPESGVNP